MWFCVGNIGREVFETGYWSCQAVRVVSGHGTLPAVVGCFWRRDCGALPTARLPVIKVRFGDAGRIGAVGEVVVFCCSDSVGQARDGAGHQDDDGYGGYD